MNRFITKLAAMAACLGLGACSAENTVSGGFPGWVQDRMFFTAKNDIDYVFRSLAVTAAMAKAATRQSANAGNKRQAIAQINGLTETLSAMHQMAKSSCGLMPAQGGEDATKLSGCANGISRLRFQSMTVDVDHQVLSLAAVALDTEALSDMLANVRNRNVIGALWDMLVFVEDNTDAAHSAYGVKRGAKQGLAFVLNSQGGRQIANFQDAQAYLSALKNNAIDTNALVSAYDVPMFSLFQDIRQSCYDIRATLSAADQKNANCPNRFYFNETVNGATCIALTGVYLGDQPLYKADGTALPASQGCACDDGCVPIAD